MSGWIRDDPESQALLAEERRLMKEAEAAEPAGYESMMTRAAVDLAYRDGLLAAAVICRAQGTDPTRPPCPSDIAALYIERVATGEQP